MEDGTKGWLAFQYEHLPNLCFWCGVLTHDDKDCEVWLKSKGRLVVDDQQFGHWMRAPQFSMGKCQSIEVKGYDMRKGCLKHVLRLVHPGFMQLKWLLSVTIQSRPKRVIIGVTPQWTVMKER